VKPQSCKGLIATTSVPLSLRHEDSVEKIQRLPAVQQVRGNWRIKKIGRAKAKYESGFFISGQPTRTADVCVRKSCTGRGSSHTLLHAWFLGWLRWKPERFYCGRFGSKAGSAEPDLVLWLPGFADPGVPGLREPGLFGGLPGAGLLGGVAAVPCGGVATVPGEEEQPTNEPNKRTIIRERIQLKILTFHRPGVKGVSLSACLAHIKTIHRKPSAAALAVPRLLVREAL